MVVLGCVSFPVSTQTSRWEGQVGEEACVVCWGWGGVHGWTELIMYLRQEGVPVYVCMDGCVCVCVCVVMQTVQGLCLVIK